MTAPQERSNRIKIFKLTRTKIDDLIFSANLVMSNQVAPEVWSINLWRVNGIFHFSPFGVTVGTGLSSQDDGFPGISQCLLMPFTHCADISHLNGVEVFMWRCYKKSHWFLSFIVVTCMGSEETRILELTSLQLATSEVWLPERSRREDLDFGEHFSSHFLKHLFLHIFMYIFYLKHLHVFCVLLKSQVSAPGCGEAGREECVRIESNHEVPGKTRGSSHLGKQDFQLRSSDWVVWGRADTMLVTRSFKKWKWGPSDSFISEGNKILNV